MDDPQVLQKPVSLHGRAGVVDGELQVDYRLENRGQAPIYVWDLLTGYADDGPFLDERLAYVCWEEPRNVSVVRAFLRLPVGFRVGKKSEPYVRTVPAGGTVEGRIRLPHPVREYNPYYPSTQQLATVPCDKVILLIGWIEQKEGMILSPREVRGKRVTALRGTWKPPFQRLARLEFACPVSLLRYTTAFDRRLPME
jgi:hypothetical protein